MKNELWTKLFGYPVNREMKEKILEEMKETGEPIEKIISKYTLPEMAILNEQGLFQYDGKMITPAEWKRLNPLHEFGRIVVIRT